MSVFLHNSCLLGKRQQLRLCAQSEENSGAEGVRFLGRFPSIVSLSSRVSWFLLSLQTTSLSRMGEPETKTLSCDDFNLSLQAARG